MISSILRLHITLAEETPLTDLSLENNCTPTDREAELYKAAQSMETDRLWSILDEESLRLLRSNALPWLHTWSIADSLPQAPFSLGAIT